MSLLDPIDPDQALRRTVIPVTQEFLRVPGEADDPLGGGTLGFALDPVGGRDPTASLLGSVMVPVTGALEVGGTTGVRYGNSATWHVGVQARVALGAPPR